MSVDGIHHVTIRVLDLERSRRFYADVLGFDVEEPPITDAPRLRFRAGACLVVLRPVLAGTPEGDRVSEYRVGVDHLALSVTSRDDLEQALDRLTRAGVDAEGIRRHPWLPSELLTFRDPDNVQWELYRELPEPP